MTKTDQKNTPLMETSGAEEKPLPSKQPRQYKAKIVESPFFSEGTGKMIAWLWRDWLALGKLHILAGESGAGKSSLSMAISAIVSSGGYWPTGEPARQGNVIIRSDEDDMWDTLFHKLKDGGADLNRICHIEKTIMPSGIKRAFVLHEDVDAVRRKGREIGNVSLIVFDPIIGAIKGDSNSNKDVREGLEALSNLAKDLNCCVLGITHFSKGAKDKSIGERVIGSQAFSAFPRVVLIAAKRPAQPRIFCKIKTNICVDEGGIEYNVVERKVTIDGETGSFGAVEWGEIVAGNADILLASRENDQESSLGRAADFLRTRFASENPILASTIRHEAEAAGLAITTISRAADSLGIKRTGHKKDAKWTLPP